MVWNWSLNLSAHHLDAASPDPSETWHLLTPGELSGAHSFCPPPPPASPPGGIRALDSVSWSDLKARPGLPLITEPKAPGELCLCPMSVLRRLLTPACSTPPLGGGPAAARSCPPTRGLAGSMEGGLGWVSAALSPLWRSCCSVPLGRVCRTRFEFRLCSSRCQEHGVTQTGLLLLLAALGLVPVPVQT